MNALVTSVSVAIVLGWVGFAVAGLFAPLPLAILAGIAVGAASIWCRESVVTRGFIALMGPVGVVLPMLALRHVAAQLGVEFGAFSAVELVVFLLAYLAFLAASMGVWPVDAYRLGYGPLPVGAMVLVLCVYGALTGNLFVPLVAVTGQFFWVKGWGSSNWFDHVLHAVLVPVVVVVLIGRML